MENGTRSEKLLEVKAKQGGESKAAKDNSTGKGSSCYKSRYTNLNSQEKENILAFDKKVKVENAKFNTGDTKVSYNSIRTDTNLSKLAQRKGS